MNEYFETGEYTDVNIICQEQVFKCHRIALAAGSEYFHLMFGGNFRERSDPNVVIHDVDSVTFGQVLRNIYTGDAGDVNEDNVYNLFRASEIFMLKGLENRCVNYLIQRRIPMDYALEIFSLAYVTRKELLLPVLSRFILAHLNHFYADESFLRISLDELNTILDYSSYMSSTEDNEKALLKMILRWTLRSTDSREDQRASFSQLTQKIEFKHVSNVGEYFDKNTTDCGNGNSLQEAPSTDGLDDRMGVKKPSFLLFITGFDSTVTKYESYYARLEKTDSAFNWSQLQVINQPVVQMRTVVLDERLYNLKSFQCRLSFDVCPSNDLFPVHSLSLPPNPEHFSGSPYFMCHDDESIYFLHWNHELHAYKRDFDTWSPVLPVLSQRFLPTMITCHERRLYLMGSKPHLKHPHGIRDTSYAEALRAYDHRVGKLEKLASCKNPHALHRDECCTYNGRIYVTHGEKRKAFMMDVYDPRAGKWDVILRKAKRMHNFSFFHRLMSFDHRLWIFYSECKDTIFYETFDSFQQEWEMERSLNLVFENKEYPRIMDAVVIHE